MVIKTVNNFNFGGGGELSEWAVEEGVDGMFTDHSSQSVQISSESSCMFTNATWYDPLKRHLNMKAYQSAAALLS